MSSLLITGSGSKLVEPLLRRLSDFDVVYLLSKNSRTTFSDSRVVCLNFDLLLSHDIPIKADSIVHLAAVVSYNRGNAVCEDIIGTNIRIFLNTMRYAVSAGVRHVVLVSSTDVYPLVVDGVIGVGTPLMPHNEYGLSKLACERVGRTISEIGPILLSIVRLGPVYSETDPNVNRVSRMLGALREHRAVTVLEPHNVPSLLHIESAADGLASVLRARRGGVSLLAGCPLSIGEFFLLAKNVYGSLSQVSFGCTSRRSVHISFDLSGSERAFGWSPPLGSDMFLARSGSDQ